MNRYLLIGTLAAAVVLFAWQTLSNAVLPWHQMTLREFEEPEMIVAALNVAAPENGLYFHERGVMAAVSMVPGVTDKSALMGIMLLRQLVLDLIAGFLLALVVARLALGATRAAFTLGGVALAAGVILELADWNWYGYPIGYALVNALDVAINAALAGIVLGMLSTRLLKDTRSPMRMPPTQPVGP